MKNNLPILIAVLVAILFVGNAIFLAYLFHFGEAGITFLFTFFYLPACAFSATYFILKRKSSKILLFIVAILGSLILQITFHPASSGLWPFPDNTWVRISQYVQTYFQYPDSITYDYLALGNKSQIVAASIKYKHVLPDRIAVLKISKKLGTSKAGGPIFDYKNPVSQLYFEKRNGVISHDDNKFVLEPREDGLWLVIDPNSSDRSEYFFTGRKFYESEIFTPYSGVSWYYGDYNFDFSNHDFNQYSGAEKIFYKIVSLK